MFVLVLAVLVVVVAADCFVVVFVAVVGALRVAAADRDATAVAIDAAAPGVPSSQRGTADDVASAYAVPQSFFDTHHNGRALSSNVALVHGM